MDTDSGSRMGEGFLGRAVRDAMGVRHNLWFWLYELVMGIVTTAIGPHLVSSAHEALLFAAGLFAAFLLMFAWHLVRTPFRQRDEARKRVEQLELELSGMARPTVAHVKQRLLDYSYKCRLLAQEAHERFVQRRSAGETPIDLQPEEVSRWLLVLHQNLEEILGTGAVGLAMMEVRKSQHLDALLGTMGDALREQANRLTEADISPDLTLARLREMD